MTFIDTRKLPFGGRTVVIVRLSQGTKIVVRAEVTATPDAEGKPCFWGWTWRANSGEWTNRMKIREENVIGPATEKDPRYRDGLKQWKPDGTEPMPRRRPAG